MTGNEGRVGTNEVTDILREMFSRHLGNRALIRNPLSLTATEFVRRCSKLLRQPDHQQLVQANRSFFLKAIRGTITQWSLAYHALMECLQQYILLKSSADCEPGVISLWILLDALTVLSGQHRHDHLRDIPQIHYVI